jgi:arginyl-tRNA synthetase
MKADIRTHLARSLSDAIAKALPQSAIAADAIVLETPKQAGHGDLASTVAMGLAKTLKAPPPAIARKIMEAYAWDDSFVVPDSSLTKTILGGFINFTISPAYLHAALQSAVNEPSVYGRNQAALPKKMLFEYVSSNPTGPMVVVNGRAAAIGDVVSRMHEWLGNTVEREFYVNDWGNQVELLGKSIAARYWQKRGRDTTIPEGGYEGGYIADLAEAIAADCPEVASMDGADLEQFFKVKALERNVAEQGRILESYRTVFTRWFRESTLHESGKVMKTFEFLKAKGLTYEQDNAVWFKATAMGDERDRVILRSDGTPTYLLADIAYHAEKASRCYDESVTFWGPDHHGHIPQLEKAVKALGIEKPVFRNFLIQQVNLIRDGQPYKMSKRKGDFVTMDDLIEEVGVDAARYFFLMRRLSTHFDFDLDLAKKKSDENPVFYVQYAHARTCNLIKHAEANGFLQADMVSAQADLLKEPEEIALMKLLAEYPNTLAQAALNLEPHRITGFAEGVATTFHSFYQKHRIVTDNKPLSLSRLLLTMGVRNILRTSLDLLGISAPEKM